MKILVASAIFAGSHRANVINTVKMAEGFARLGHHVTLLCRCGSQTLTVEELNQMYGIRSNIKWIRLSWTFGKHYGFAMRALYKVRKLKPDLIFARNYVLPWATARIGIPTIVESHAHKGKRTLPFHLLASVAKEKFLLKWITISDKLKKYYAEMGVPEEKICVLPDAVDFDLFKRPEALPPSPYDGHGPHVVYAGHLYDYKGIPTVINAARLLPNCKFHFVGGTSEDIVQQQKYAKDLNVTNIIFHGTKHHSAMPNYLWHADVLLLPPSANHPSAMWTSPMKLGEYLSSGSPVVATDIPALRTWLSEGDVEFIAPDDPRDMARGIREVISDMNRQKKITQRALKKAAGLSYEGRAREILKVDCYEDSLSNNCR